MRGDIRRIRDGRWLLFCWAALGLCSAGHAPPHGGRRPAQHGPAAPGIRAPAGYDHRGRRICAPITENCGRGYYRQRRGLYLSQCVPCRCNGLSDECEDGTGRCLNCGYNTAGDHCERCKEGYYGNPAQRTCRVCPCPFTSLSSSFATSCRDLPEGFECVCKPGYTGLRCERCASGYYGNPMAFRGSCLPCNCDTGICDSRTGECINNVEPNNPNNGDQCQECDSCVQALLIDLEGMDDELESLKAQLKNISGGVEAQEALKKLEDAIAVTKALVEKYNSSVYTQVSKVGVLDADVSSFNEDMGQLREKADRIVQTAQEVVDSTNETHQRAADLASETQNLLQNIQDLLKKLKGANSSVSTEEVEKMLTEARRLVRQMELHDCTAQREAAEREREESRKLLHYIQNNMTQPQARNQDAADRIAGLLKQYEARLKDLEEALGEADRAVGRAVDHNRRNAAALENILQRSKELEKERDMVAGQISMARDQLSDIADLLKMLEDIKMDYEGLAALLDGAKTKLTQKVNDIARAATKETVVVWAEKHAEELDRLARELQEAVRNASDIQDVHRAVDAISGYRDIIDAIAAAAEAAERAKEAADVALSDVRKEGLPDRARDLKDQASTLLEEAKEIQANLNKSSDEQKAQRKRIDEAQRKKNMLEEDLLKAWQKLNETRRDDIAEVLNEAKGNVTLANDTVNDAMERLSFLTEGLDKINVTSPGLDFDGILKDLNETVSNLTDTLTPLLNQTEELSSRVPAPGSNVSESIRRIKELIEQARDTANRIPVPMDFAGDGYVEMRPPTDLEDLRAYTAIELTLQRPLPPSRGDNRRVRRQSSGDMFVLYLGNRNSSKDYIGMALKNNVLRCIYSLGGTEREMALSPITESSSETTVWDKVDFYRIYQDAKVVFTKSYNLRDPDAPLSETAQGDSVRTLLDLDPKQVVFYVGGYPKDFEPPESLRYPMYKGCIEFYTLNDQYISLYNFQNAAGVNKQKPCKRPSPDKLYKYFEGTGYARVNITDGQQIHRFFQFVISQSENGMLLYIKGQDSHYSINVEKGHIVLRGREGDKVLEEKSASKEFPLPEGKDIQVILQGHSKKILVRVRGAEVINADFMGGMYNTYYIGGLPEFLRERDRIAIPPFKGCMSNIKQDGSNVQFEEEIGIRPGCAKQLLAIRESTFHLGSSLSAAPRGFGLTGDVIVSLGFRSTENKGLLLKNSQGNNGIELSLDDGFVVFKFNNEAWRSNKMYKDGKWHYLTAVRNGSRIEMRVDEEDLGQVQALSSPVPANGQDVLLGNGTFQGCLSNLYMRRPDNLYRPENLTVFNSSGDVLLGFCAAERPPQLLTAGRGRDADRRRAGKASTVSGCSLPSPVKHAYHLGGPASYLSYNITPQALSYRPHFSLAFRTASADGLLLYINGRARMALYVANGRIRLSVGRSRPIVHREKCSDGKWHTVVFSLEGRAFHMVFDGIRTGDGVLSNTESFSLDLQPAVYLGAVPPSAYTDDQVQGLPRESVVGCIRNFRINNKRMEEPSANHGVLPCFDGATEGGAYFSGNGGYAVLSKYGRFPFTGVTFHLEVEVRPQNLTGVLFHIAGHGGEHLTLYMRDGEVVLQVNSAAGVVSVSVARRDLCDGRFHRVAVTRTKRRVRLDVDIKFQRTKLPRLSSAVVKRRWPIYAAGIPDSLRVTKLPVRSSFVGCMRNVRIDRKNVSFEEASHAFGPVNLRECPAG
ncbi:hypothetical protein MATL_G00023120 [Megalops atlanticus]|uniref:Laminin subunit alpha-3 n=1 Tax=Megalops atlanticus TaxID=7932 RepID=A0A9D3QDK3_MEGAT|nr:hypothetical protein MATL_G00023120 [Megalops atlanticus]